MLIGDGVEIIESRQHLLQFPGNKFCNFPETQSIIPRKAIRDFGMTETIDRWQSETVKRALSERRVVLLVGARQCGKTTLARSLGQKDLEYRTLDERALLEAARADP